ncbi:MAG TPA: carboxylesterase family protein [Acidimicrobiales bacterium]|nr:carboxylesterase family protein [Acidimicrobiales bacterium]
MITTTTAGKIEGLERTTRGATTPVYQFRGVPYAAATGGANRFLPAKPVESWEGVRAATTSGPSAPQPLSALEGVLGGQQADQGEDCLSMTITTPGLDGARPVMVWIHGGAFVGGSGSVPWYDGESFARNGDVVVVSINYRLGALGFMHVGHLLGEAYADSGSAGIADQITALEWVRDNIAAFGGDPNRVTIFGESAGGMSVGSILGAPRGAGLFGTAIAQSGAAHNASSLDQAAEVTSLVLGELGLRDSDAELLLSVGVEELMAAQAAVNLKLTESRGPRGMAAGGLPFQPVFGTPTLPGQPLDAIRGGNAASVRVVTGTTTEEWKLFGALLAAQQPLDADGLRSRATAALGDRGGDFVDVYTANRPGQKPDDVWSAIVTDFVFRIPAIRMLEAQRAHRDDVFLYEFGHRSTAFGGALGACHAIEIPFAFDNVHKRGVSGLLGDIGDAEQKLASETNAAWIAAASGDEPWTRYDLDERVTRRFGGDMPGELQDPAGDERLLWDGVR